MQKSERRPNFLNGPPLEAHTRRPWAPDSPQHSKYRRRGARLLPETMRNIEARTRAIQEEILGSNTTSPQEPGIRSDQ